MIEITGLEAVQRKLKGLSELGHNTEPLMHTIGNIIANSIKDSFEDEKSPFGQKWAALKPSTAAQKAKKGKSDKILRRDGYLADKWVVDADSKKAVVSNNSKHKGFAYGLVHQFGTHKAGRSNTKNHQNADDKFHQKNLALAIFPRRSRIFFRPKS